jgi:hypothetical protein
VTDSSRNRVFAEWKPGVEFGTVRSKEKEIIDKQRKIRGQLPGSNSDPDEFLGLALSGGGIRSAAFAFGAMAALKDSGVLHRVDYLSTVSGGGFAGTALTWYVRQIEELSSRDKDKQPDFRSSQAFDGLLGSRDYGQRTESDWTTMGDHIRMYGDYLRPLSGMSTVSILSAVMRNMLMSVLAFCLCLSALLTLPPLVHYLLTPAESEATVATMARHASHAWIWLAAICWVAFAFWSVIYGIEGWKYERKEFKPADPTSLFAATERNDDDRHAFRKFYIRRIRRQIRFGRGLTVTLIMTTFAILAWLTHSKLSNQQAAVAFGLSALVAGFAALLSAMQFAESRILEFVGGPLRASVRIYLACALLVSATVLASHFGAVLALSNFGGLVLLWISAMAATLIGFRVDVNYTGVHRMYRDRLMEAFMPDRSALAKQRWWPAVKADWEPLSTFKNDDRGGPFHILNANLVLVNSDDPTFRGRGGDNFVLSALYCGGDAIGWHPSTTHPFEHLTMASAMAISGAAINPNTAPAGEGVTRSRIVSSVLALANIRLGYWLPNPAFDPQWVCEDPLRPGRPKRRGALDRLYRTIFREPTMMPMALWQAIPKLGYDVDDQYIELTDGGHFDNTGLYELFRRRVRTMLLVDGSQDPSMGFADLANALERARLDFAIQAREEDDFRMRDVIPSEELPFQDFSKEIEDKRKRISARPFLVMRVVYPDTPTEKAFAGTLIVVKPTLLDKLPLELMSFARTQSSFPHLTTADQFFDESKFDAYRQLGFYLMKRTLKDCFASLKLRQRHSSVRVETIVEREWPHDDNKFDPGGAIQSAPS